VALSARRRAGNAWLALALVLRPLQVLAQGAGSSSEAAVKAAYLLKFPAYVDWPAAAFDSPDAAQVIGVLGAEKVLAELEWLVVGRRVNGHPVLARRVLPGDSLDGVHVLHVGPGMRVPPLLGLPVLVVTDAPNGLLEQGVLNFVTVDRRVRFEASVAAAERAGLKLSARLLAVAERVVMP
jgi:hypothetical protein